jgi:hypothetical protein
MDLMSSVRTSSATLDRRTASADRRWLVLVVVAVAQLMLVLDATIVNIALPSAQQALGFSNSDRQWVVTAYALSFGVLAGNPRSWCRGDHEKPEDEDEQYRPRIPLCWCRLHFSVKPP